MMFSKAKCRVLPWGQGKPQYQYRLGDEGIEISPEEKDLGVLVDEKLDISHQVGLTAQKSTLLYSGETPPAVLHPALEPSAQEGCGPVGAGLEEGLKDDPRAGTPLLLRKAEKVGAVQPGGEKAPGRPYHGLSVLKVGL